MTIEAERSTSEDKSTEEPATIGWLAHEKEAGRGLRIRLYAHFLCSSQFPRYQGPYSYSALIPTLLGFYFWSKLEFSVDV